MAQACTTRGRKMEDVRNDYEGFVEKFKPKLTTDDCYTPPAVYDAVLNYVRTELDPLEGCTIRRPFKPGGDYQAEAESYGPNDVVVDNPPFSLTAQIVRFYVERGIRFFIFAPGLTLFQKPHPGVTYIVADAGIYYKNGAKVPTGFITNMEGKHRIIVCPKLHDAIEAVNIKPGQGAQRKIAYPWHVLTPGRLRRLAGNGCGLKVLMDECEFTRKCGAAVEGIFGGGYIVSDAVAAAAAKVAVVAKEVAAVRAIAAANKAPDEVIELSEREREIIARLSKNSAQNCCPNG